MKIKANLPTKEQALRILRAGSRGGRRLTAAQKKVFTAIARGNPPKRKTGRPNPLEVGYKSKKTGKRYGFSLKRLSNPQLGPGASLNVKIDGEVYHRIGGIWAQKGPGHACDPKCKAAGHWWEHPFTESFPLWGLTNGMCLF
jgi:hypothetical protein